MERRRAWAYGRCEDIARRVRSDALAERPLFDGEADDERMEALGNVFSLVMYGGVFRNVLTRLIYRRFFLNHLDIELPLSRDEFQSAYRTALSRADGALSAASDPDLQRIRGMVREQISQDLTDPYTAEFPPIFPSRSRS